MARGITVQDSTPHSQGLNAVAYPVLRKRLMIYDL